MPQNKKKDRSHLIELVRSHSSEIEKLPESYRDYFDTRTPEISVDEWIDEFFKQKNILTIDVRSEAEFEKDHLPSALNFPILNNSERDEVGFLYKQVSPKSALFFALRSAAKKSSLISDLCDRFKDKHFIVYCWRGGGRSSAACHYFSQHGIRCTKIEGGYKAYRNKIYDLFYKDASGLSFVILSGLTGCGKTEILEKLAPKVPVLDIEKAAGHASSLFGHVRYELKNADIPSSQIQFENNLFQQILSAKRSDLPFLSESESKKISNFTIPEKLYEALLASPVIEIRADIKKRTERIKAEYFSGGIEPVYKTVENSYFLKKKLGYEKVSELLNMLKEGNIDRFCEWFLTRYYDIRYAAKFTNIIARIKNDDTSKAAEEILSIIKKASF
ncbi:MAG: tRNA 2-selenouridine(34) synthase MnmH [Candidatus Delongbacteria bacterium]